MKRNIAVVGCGYWGRNLVRNFAELGALHTICDANAGALEEILSLPTYPELGEAQSKTVVEAIEDSVD